MFSLFNVVLQRHKMQQANVRATMLARLTKTLAQYSCRTSPEESEKSPRCPHLCPVSPPLIAVRPRAATQAILFPPLRIRDGNCKTSQLGMKMYSFDAMPTIPVPCLRCTKNVKLPRDSYISHSTEPSSSF
jgi:hypothetical protein